MSAALCIGDRVKVYLDSKFGMNEGWYNGEIIRIDPYSEHRSFHWVKLDEEARALLGLEHISVFNPKNIMKIEKRLE